MIRLANGSDHGWGVVDQYTADESNNEKRIEWAENAAQKKSTKKVEEVRSGSWEIARHHTV